MNFRFLFLLFCLYKMLPIMAQQQEEPLMWVRVFYAEMPVCDDQDGGWYAPHIVFHPDHSDSGMFICNYAMAVHKDGELIRREDFWTDKTWVDGLSCTALTDGTCFFNGLDDGVYKLSVDYQVNGGEWKSCIGSDSIFIDMEIKEKKAYFHNRIINGDGFTIDKMQVHGTSLVNQILSVEATVTNNTEFLYHSFFLYVNGKIEGVGFFNNMEKGETRTSFIKEHDWFVYNYEYKPTEAGDYTFAIVDGDGNTVLSELVNVKSSPIVKLSPKDYRFEQQVGDYVSAQDLKLYVTLRNESDNDYTNPLRAEMKYILSIEDNDTLWVKRQFSNGTEKDYYTVDIPAHETKEIVFDYGYFGDINDSPFQITISYFSGNDEIVVFKTPLFYITHEDISNIDENKVDQTANHDVYNLQGVKVGTTEQLDMLPHGIYIFEKKKFIKK